MKINSLTYKFLHRPQVTTDLILYSPPPVPTDLPYPVPTALTSAVLTTPLQPLRSVPMYRVPQVAVTRQLHRQLPEPGPDAGGRVPHPAARPAAQLGGGALHLGGRGALDQRLRVGGALDERVRFLKRQPGIDRPARQPVWQGGRVSHQEQTTGRLPPSRSTTWLHLVAVLSGST